MKIQSFGLLLLILLTACASPASELAPTASPPEPSEISSPTETATATIVPAETHSPTPTPLTCWDEDGLLVEDSVPSQLLPEAIPLLIYLPPCYFSLPEAEFPTLYLIHGQSF